MIAAVAAEMHIAPSVLLAESDEMLDAIIGYVQWRSKRAENATRKR